MQGPEAQIESMVRSEFRATEDIDRAIEQTAINLCQILMCDELPDTHQKLLLQIGQRIREELEPRYPRPADVVASAEAKRWYTNEIPREQINKYLDHLSQKNWPQSAIDAVRDFSRTIVGLCGDPANEKFDVRGLVVGHVQSGKTANMTGVIARAADAGYNLIIVLAGMSDSLRHQTQKRIMEDLADRDTIRWHCLTSLNEYDQAGNLRNTGEYKGFTHGKFPRANPDQTQLIVVKKNAAVLRRLKKDLEGTPEALLCEYCVLIIDDEADQASPNTGKDDSPTATNRLIREILDVLPRNTYIGYTATPFANVLIQPFLDPETQFQKVDLYPKDFIFAIHPGEGYFGAAELFGVGDEVDAELDVLRDIPSADVSTLRMLHNSDLPQSMITAAEYYLLAATARRLRGLDEHTTMMVNVAHTTADHETIANKLRIWFNAFSARVRRQDPELFAELSNLWNAETQRVPPALFGHKALPASQLLKMLPDVLNAVQIVEENAVSDERLNFDPAMPKVWIAVGGFILSRGLTLEGLTVSYFARSSKQYDTLLQMGRWFGYRDRYEDLQRIWATQQCIENYRALAVVEQELRDEIEQYALRKATPTDLAVRIPTLPGLSVTAPAKMRHATRMISYFGQHKQTIRFYRLNRDWLQQNWTAGADLIERLHGDGWTAQSSRQWRRYMDVPVNHILTFLRSYRVHESQRDLEPDWLAAFVERNVASLAAWNVVVCTGPVPDRLSDQMLGPLGRLPTILRARLSIEDEAVGYIKALMSRRDALADLDGIDNASTDSWAKVKEKRFKHTDRPLLLLYPVDKKSQPRNDSGPREALDAVCDVLGIGIVFPPGRGGIDEGNYVRVELRPDEAAPEADEEPGS